MHPYIPTNLTHLHYPGRWHNPRVASRSPDGGIRSLVHRGWLRPANRDSDDARRPDSSWHQKAEPPEAAQGRAGQPECAWESAGLHTGKRVFLLLFLVHVPLAVSSAYRRLSFTGRNSLARSMPVHFQWCLSQVFYGGLGVSWQPFLVLEKLF